MKKNSWDISFFKIANEIATHSTCCKYKVGAVSVKDNRILSVGYNGVASGQKHCTDVVKEEIIKNINLHGDTDFIKEIAPVDSFDGRKFSINLFGSWVTAIIKREGRSDENPVVQILDYILNVAIPEKKIDEEYEPGKGFRKWHHDWSKDNEIHAEQNCILWAGRNNISLENTKLYVTLSPCIQCAKMIIAAGIKRVLFGGEDRRNKPDDGVKLLMSAGVEVIHYDSENFTYYNTK